MLTGVAPEDQTDQRIVEKPSWKWEDAGDRFSKDPAAAARFGIYTVVIMVVSVAVFVILSLTVGFVWSWLALVAGFVVFFLVLARMLFPAGRNDSNGAHHE